MYFFSRTFACKVTVVLIARLWLFQRRFSRHQAPTGAIPAPTCTRTSRPARTPSVTMLGPTWGRPRWVRTRTTHDLPQLLRPTGRESWPCEPSNFGPMANDMYATV